MMISTDGLDGRDASLVFIIIAASQPILIRPSWLNYLNSGRDNALILSILFCIAYTIYVLIKKPSFDNNMDYVFFMMSAIFGAIAVAPSPVLNHNEVKKFVKVGLTSYVQGYQDNDFSVGSVQEYNLMGGSTMKLQPTGSTTIIDRDTQTDLQFLAFGNINGGALPGPLQVIIASSKLGIHLAISDVYSHPSELADAMVNSNNQTKLQHHTQINWLSYNLNNDIDDNIAHNDVGHGNVKGKIYFNAYDGILNEY